jgi:transcriptional regulator with XRE-family HTH domain
MARSEDGAMATGQNPLAQQRRLRGELRQSRTLAGLTQRTVAEELDWSTSKVIRIETGAVGVSTTDLRALLQLYGVTDQARVAELVEMAKAARQKAWWDDYRDGFNAKLVNFVASEAGAAGIRQFQSLIVPGALQTAEYARAVLRAFGSEPELVERAIRMRLARKDGLVAVDGPSATFVLDESVLLRRVGAPEIMRAQVAHLEELDSLPRISIKVVPFDAGVHDGMQVSFTIFEFDDEGPEHVVYLNQPGELVLVKNDADEVCHYIELFTELDERASALAEFVGRGRG